MLRSAINAKTGFGNSFKVRNYFLAFFAVFESDNDVVALFGLDDFRALDETFFDENVDDGLLHFRGGNGYRFVFSGKSVSDSRE